MSGKAKTKTKLKASASHFNPSGFKFNFNLDDDKKGGAASTPTASAKKLKKSATPFNPSAQSFTPSGYTPAKAPSADAEAKKKKTAEEAQKAAAAAEEQTRVEAAAKAEEEQQKKAAEEKSSVEAPADSTGPVKFDRATLMAFEMTCKGQTADVKALLNQYPQLKLPEGKSWRDSRVKGHGFNGRGPPRGRGPPSQQHRNKGGRGMGRGPRRDNNRNNEPASFRRAPPKALDFGENRYVVKKDVPPDEKLVRQVRSLMAKLTPEKFEPLLKQFLALEIGSIPRLRDVVDIVFNTALSEPGFSPTYADLCKHLDTELKESYTETDEEGNEHDITFTRLLLSQLKDEFAAGLKDKTEEELAELAKLSPEALDAKNQKTRQRRRGMIRFIGELFLRDLIKKAVIHACFGDLLDVENPDEENIEELCRLLATVGKKITAKKSVPTEETMARLLLLVEQGAIKNSRVRFLIADTDDLRKDNWKPRIKKVEAKKLSEIHAEMGGAAQTSREEKSRRIKEERRREYDRQNKRGNPRPKPRKTSDGFSTVANKKGRRGGGNHSRESSSRPLQLPRGFVAMKQKREEEKRAKERAQRPSGGAFAGLMDSESEDNESSAEETKVEEKKPAVPAKSRDQVVKEIESFVKEYMGVGDMEEATLCVNELGTAEWNHNIVFMGATMSLEKKEPEQKRFKELLEGFYEAKLLTKGHIKTGLDELMKEVVEAMLFIDYPKLWDIIGLYFSALQQKGAIGLDFLTAERTPPFSELKKSQPKLYIGIFKALKAAVGSDDALVALVRGSSGFTLSALNLTAELLEPAGLASLSQLL